MCLALRYRAPNRMDRDIIIRPGIVLPEGLVTDHQGKTLNGSVKLANVRPFVSAEVLKYTNPSDPLENAIIKATGFKQGHLWFGLPEGYGIAGLLDREGSLYIITVPSKGKVQSVHSRMPMGVKLRIPSLV